MRFLIPFLILSSAFPCTIKQYTHRGVYDPSPVCFEDECIEYPQQYAIPLLSFIKPTNVWKLDLSPLNCEKEAKILHNLMIEKADKFHWGHETKFKALFSKGKLKYRNPNYIEANL